MTVVDCHTNYHQSAAGAVRTHGVVGLSDLVRTDQHPDQQNTNVGAELSV